MPTTMDPKIENDESVNDRCLSSSHSSSTHLPANNLLGQYLNPLSGTRKRQIEESDETLVAPIDQQHLPPDRNHDETKGIGVRDTSQANDFSTQPRQFSSPSLISAPTVISDAGNQQFKELKARKEKIQDSNSDVITDASTSGLPYRTSRNRGGRSEPSFRFELQQKLRSACLVIKNPMYHGHEKYFLPRGELENLINVESVTKELIERGFKKEYAHATAIQDQHLLPFFDDKRALSRKLPQQNDDQVMDWEEIESGFSKVFMVWVHSQHHDLSGLECDRGFAIKQLMKPSEEAFNQEVEMLKKFIGDRSHPHIVSLLATYKQYGKYHMIFHRADGNLFEYWRDICPAPELNYDTVKWVAKQLDGLSDGLLRFHKHISFLKCYDEPVQPDINESIQARSQSQPRKRARFEPVPRNDSKGLDQDATRLKTKYGRHGDLKPENILWFPDLDDPIGILKISDLGQAQIHSTISKTRRESNGIHTLTYRPPESDIEPYLIRQSGDIWSLGCIILEFITWALGSWELVAYFKAKRVSDDQYSPIKSDTFYELKQVPGMNHSGAQIKPAVTQHIQHLRSHPKCTAYFSDVLDLVERGMLIIEPSENYADYNRRKNCGEIRHSLRVYYNNCLKSETYAAGPR
ncbi:hypothetical protein FPOAC1_004261 [Fusarium poae]|uniref:hypothetical protein n=1 Tax=Fusarium poae TaxID=36050 RepID=UPI001CE8E68D|nr:hypothetical protein FPOAC1_004261 [Fusarium poae]KAG8671024.1 hypothetical protein FPOAC1_004261 [Fusarium poae]